jgi:hypothetical protein
LVKGLFGNKIITQVVKVRIISLLCFKVFKKYNCLTDDKSKLKLYLKNYFFPTLSAQKIYKNQWAVSEIRSFVQCQKGVTTQNFLSTNIATVEISIE